MNPWNYIAELEKTSGKKAKLAVLQRAVSSEEFRVGAEMAYDPFKKYYIKKIPIQTGTGGKGLPFSMFKSDVEKLATRQVTGHAARDLVELLMWQATAEQWNGWYRRILLRDLKCGAQVSSVNKALNERGFEPIKTYSCQLAYAIKDKPNHFKGKVLLETKYDGARLNMFVDPKGTDEETISYALSREGNPLYNFVALEREIAKIAQFLPEKWMFDAEVVSGEFYKMMKSFKRKQDTGVTDAVLMIFDAVPARIIEDAGTYEVPLKERKRWLETFFENYGHHLPNCVLTDYEEVDLDTEEGREAYRAFNAEQVRMSKIDPKVEGTMTKKANGFYHTKRTADWLKEKPYIEVTLEVVGFEYGKEEGKNAERLGALICKGHDLGEDIEVSVGGGYTEEERDWIAKHFDTHVKGHLIEITADDFTEHEKRPGIKSLRFPIVKAFRGFTPGQKI